MQLLTVLTSATLLSSAVAVCPVRKHGKGRMAVAHVNGQGWVIWDENCTPIFECNSSNPCTCSNEMTMSSIGCGPKHSINKLTVANRKYNDCVAAPAVANCYGHKVEKCCYR